MRAEKQEEKDAREEERNYRRQRDAQYDALFDQLPGSEEAIRQRFISFFKRGVLKQHSLKDCAWIRDGNAVAHHGNAYRDAHLYDNGVRTDSKVYGRLYGFRPHKILTMNRKFFQPTKKKKN